MRLLASSLLLASLALPGPARAWCRRTTVEPTPGDPCPTTGVPLQWRQPCIEFAIDTAGGAGRSPAELSAIVDDAFERWESIDCGRGSTPFDVREHPENSSCQYAQFLAEGPNVNTVAFVPDAAGWAARMYDPGALALTTTWHGMRSGEIFDADILVNASLGPYDACPDGGCPAGVSDLPSVLTHEAGHFFGLGHTSVPEATMIGAYEMGETHKRTLHPDDQAGFCAIYTGQTLNLECDYAACNGVALVCDPGAPVGGRISGCWDSGGGGCSIGAATAAPTGWLLLVLAAALVTAGRRASGGRRSPAREGRPPS